MAAGAAIAEAMVVRVMAARMALVRVFMDLPRNDLGTLAYFTYFVKR
jgi:hypothetical protein